MSKFEVKGLAELERKLLKLDSKTGVKIIRQAGRQAMKPVLASAKHGVNVDSGDSKNAMAISATKGKGDAVVNINVGGTRRKASKKQGGGKFVGVNRKVLSQEFGTSRQKAKPFLRPALINNTQTVLSVFKRELAKKIDKAMK